MQRSKKRVVTLSLVFVLMGFLKPISALAAETSRVDFAGNLNSQAEITAGVPALPGATFAEMDEASQFSTFIDVYDSLSALHTLTIYFFRTYTRTWQIVTVADGGEIVGGTAGAPSLIGQFTMTFQENGQRTHPIPYPDFTGYATWNNGASHSVVDFSFNPFTEHAEASQISSATRDGSLPAKVTTEIIIGGNLDASSPVTSGIPALPGATYDELELASQFSYSVTIFDSLGTPHKAKLYFFKSATLPVATWQAAAVVDGAVVTGGTVGLPTQIGQSSFVTFRPDGQRTAPIPFPDFTAVVDWNNGAVPSAIDFAFNSFTQFAYSSTVTFLSNDGGPSSRAGAGGLDFDGDGTDDLAIWRPSIGYWAVLKSSENFYGNDIIWKQWGLPGDYPMAGDYDGDKKADLVVWRPSTAIWYICSSHFNFDCKNYSLWPQQFGLPGDKPIRGDFDGDGVFDFAVWRFSNLSFYFQSSRTGEILEKQWGHPLDIPLGVGVKSNR